MYYKDNHVKIYNQNFLDNDLPDESVQCVVTSPPYWGLRKYEGEQDLVWGGDKQCEHRWQGGNAGLLHENRNFKRGKQGDVSGSGPLVAVRDERLGGDAYCSLCGAWKGSYGLEPTPDCGRPFVKLRDDLTEKELEYVMGELKRCGLV